MVEKLKKYMTLFQWAECLAIIVFTIYFALTNTTDTWWYILIDSLAAVCGVFCVVLCAGGKKSQYYWGFVNIIAYIIIALINKYYGEVMLNALYYLPTQFIGLYVWGKHYNKPADQVEGLRMDGKHIVIWSICSVAGIFVYKLVLDTLGGNATLLDSMSTVIYDTPVKAAGFVVPVPSAERIPRTESSVPNAETCWCRRPSSRLRASTRPAPPR